MRQREGDLGRIRRAGWSLVDLVAVIALSLAVVSGFWLLSRHGLGIGELDAPHYVAMAESLAAGDGLLVPFGDAGRPLDPDSAATSMRHFPGGYPLLAALPIMAGSDVIGAFRIVNAIVVCLTVVFWYVIARKLGNGRIASCLVTGIGTAAGLPFALRPHSEMLYGLFLLVVLFVVSRWMTHKRPSLLIGSSALAGLSIGVRYIGVALLATVLVVALVSSRGRDRYRNGALVAASGGTLGFAVIMIDSGGLPREWAWHPMGLVDLRLAWDTVSGWLVPPQLGVVAGSLLVVVLVTIVASSISRVRPARPDSSLWLPGVTSALAHVGVLFTSGMFFDASDSFGVRLMYPVALSLLLSIAAVTGAWSTTGSAAERRSVRLLALLGAGALVSSLMVAGGEALKVEGGDFGFLSRSFRESPVIQAALTDDGPLFSNVPDGLYILGRRGVWAVPAEVNLITTHDNVQFDQEVDFLEQAVEGGAKIVAIRTNRTWLLDGLDLDGIAPCVLVADSVGEIRAASGPGC